MREKDASIQERRKYLRLDSVFPVQFRLIEEPSKQFLSPWQIGFTNNISKGGLCLVASNIDPDTVGHLKGKQVKLSLKIEMPVWSAPVPAMAKIAWVKEVAQEPIRYLIGLAYEEIDPCLNSKIMRFALTKRLFAPVAISLIIVLGVAFGLNAYIGYKLMSGNRALVNQLVKIAQESSIAKQKIKEITREREELQLNIKALETRINAAGEEISGSQAGSSAQLQEMNALIEQLTREKTSLQEELIAVQSKESVITEELLRLDKRKATLEKANLDKMYQWLKVHQNPRTGLLASFEGDSDIANWAFTYDSALAVNAFTYFADYPRAKKILDFYSSQAKRMDGRFLNAYYVNDGSPAEFVVHSGPNIWLGIACVQYCQKAKDKSYLPLAEEIARSIMQLQQQDADGGIRGGPQVGWFATEHNVDAYAFFNMLYKVTGTQAYAMARDKVLSWLVNHTYDRQDVPIQRGKGDATIATDTYAWSIAAVGPEKLEQLGMNPDKIMEFAEQTCVVEANFVRPDGQVLKVRGFDFAPEKHVARGGIVSSEWTAQMILAFKIMADFYYRRGMVAKARAYELKADNYLVQLSSMVISSPSASGQGESCLPYATQSNVDTGHGWITPQGNSTGSVAGTAYTLFAYYKYNPLQLKE